MNKIIRFFKDHSSTFTAIAFLLLGVAGGIIGSLFAKPYFDPLYNFSADKYVEQGFIISNPKNVIVQQDVKMNETVNSVSNSLVGIYKKQKSVEASGAFRLENFYELSKASGEGFIITADGWIVTDMALGKNYTDYVVITSDRKIYAIDKTESDSLSGLNFIHVAAKDFSVKKFAESKDIKRGSLVVSVNWPGSSWISSVKELDEKSNLIKSSDISLKKIILNDKAPAEFYGAVVFNLAGDAIGLIGNNGEIQLINSFSGVVKNLLQGKTPKRASLGVNYINLTELAAVNGQSGQWQKGAIIYKDQKGVAISKNSPAEKSGLKEGDIITSIDNVEINKETDLADIISAYAPGETVDLTFLRANGEKEVQVVLAELK